MPVSENSRLTRHAPTAVLALYLAAKITEYSDHAIYETLGIASGHTVKHLLAAAAGAVIVAALASRVRNSRRPRR